MSMTWQATFPSQALTQAATLWRLAAEQGHALSQFNLGTSCFRGIGINIDIP